jgi:hypothetical protein
VERSAANGIWRIFAAIYLGTQIGQCLAYFDVPDKRRKLQRGSSLFNRCVGIDASGDATSSLFQIVVFNR